MSKKQSIYWTCQVTGWTLYTLINLFFFKLSYTTNIRDVFNFILWLPVGIGITHLFRYIVVHFNILRSRIISQILFILISSLIMAFFYVLLTIGLAKIFGVITYKVSFISILSTILNCTGVFLFWCLIYFGFHYFDNYKKTEIQNLRLEANSKEVELNRLKAQLNPHFMFNSMNSIRALIDENPVKAKLAVTQLAHILRHSLLSNKNKFISLEEELNLVKDYLELEHIRYEERLRFTFDIDPNTLQKQIPPMIIQTLAENAIKHGISKQTKGGEIKITSSLSTNGFKIQILNTGQLIQNESDATGFGISNTINRLKLLYGDGASFSLTNEGDNIVLSELIIKV